MFAIASVVLVLALAPAWWLVRLLVRGLMFPSYARTVAEVNLAFERIVQQECSSEQWARIRARFLHEFPP